MSGDSCTKLEKGDVLVINQSALEDIFRATKQANAGRGGAKQSGRSLLEDLFMKLKKAFKIKKNAVVPVTLCQQVFATL